MAHFLSQLYIRLGCTTRSRIFCEMMLFDTLIKQKKMMFSFQLLFYFVTLFASIVADIRYDKLNFTLFDDQPTQFERNLINALETTKNFFAREDITNVINGAAAAANFLPFVNNLVNILPALRQALSSESDWHATFVKTLANEVSHQTAESEIRVMDNALETVQPKVKLLTEENNPDAASRKTIASGIHTELDKILNAFKHKNSLLRKYTLIGAPPFILLSALVATFTPLAQVLIPAEMRESQLACKALDNLLDYRPRTVSDRLDKIHSDHFRYTEAKTRVLLLPYNGNGYNKSKTVQCKKGCAPPVYYVASSCMKDDFSTEQIEANQRTVRIKPAIDDACWEGYNSYVRHKIEQQFPVATLSSLCNRTQQTPNGKFTKKKKEFNLKFISN